MTPRSWAVESPAPRVPAMTKVAMVRPSRMAHILLEAYGAGLPVGLAAESASRGVLGGPEAPDDAARRSRLSSARPCSLNAPGKASGSAARAPCGPRPPASCS